MRLFLEALKNALIDLSPEEVMGALILALALALVPAGIMNLRRRRREAPDFLATLCALLVPCLIVAMVLGNGYGRYLRQTVPLEPNHRMNLVGLPVHQRPFGPPVYVGPGSPSRGFGVGNPLVVQLFAIADADQDGRLSPDEAARLIERAD